MRYGKALEADYMSSGKWGALVRCAGSLTRGSLRKRPRISNIAGSFFDLDSRMDKIADRKALKIVWSVTCHCQREFVCM